MVPRRRDADGRPAARALRPAPDDPDRRAGGRSGSDGDADAHEMPSALLWALVLLLALNPPRAAFGIPRAGSRGRWSCAPPPWAERWARSRPASLALLGAAAAAGARGLGVDPPLLDALDVSDPSFRLAGADRGGGRHRGPVPPPALARPRAARLARGARAGGVPAGRPPDAARARPRRGRRPRRPADRRRDGRSASRSWPPSWPRWRPTAPAPEPSAGPPACSPRA